MNLNLAPESAPQLKQRRLSGIFDSLEARNRQAIEAKLACTDFLALLISDEVARREQKKFSTRLRRAQLRTTKTLEQFDFERLPQLNRALERLYGQKFEARRQAKDEVIDWLLWYTRGPTALDAGLRQLDEVRARLACQSTKASQFVTRL